MNKAFLIAGLAYGDEGKGADVDYMARCHGANLIVRYNGGCQAAHNVVLDNGQHHTFSQFGSAMLIPEVRTHLSRFMMVDPLAMMAENEHLIDLGTYDAFERTSIDEMCLVTTPFHRTMNRLLEYSRGDYSHGSCGVGIGVTRQYDIEYPGDSIKVRDLFDKKLHREKLIVMVERFKKQADKLTTKDNLDVLFTWWEYYDQIDQWCKQADMVQGLWLRNPRRPDFTVIFEGAQGILLDERDEFYPHNTWSDTTFKNADTLLKESKFEGEVTRIGCVRTYLTRHGKGPLPAESATLNSLPENHNEDSGYQGKFRRGHFDFKVVSHALDIAGGVDEIHMSHVDQLPAIYKGMTPLACERYIDNLEQLLETPITVAGHGPKASDRVKHVKTFTARRRSTDTRTGVSGSTEETARVG